MPLTTDPLVYTKLRPSRARPRLVARPRLTAALEREAGRKLTLISAPAGFGKTALLVEWLKGREDGKGSFAWVSLDEGDNDPVRFLSYLVAELGRTVGEGFGEGVLAALRSPGPRMEAMLGALINELADLPGEVAVVLDDYHVIDSESVHRIVALLLERLPEGVHLVMQIGMVRALGFQRGRVGLVFPIESSSIALLGIGVGVALGLGFSGTLMGNIGQNIPGLEYRVPWGALLLVVAVGYAASLLTTLLPTRAASKVYPAEALRYE